MSSLESSGLTVSRNGCKECCGHGLVVEHHRGPGPFFGRKEPLLVGTGQQTHAKKYFVRLHLGTFRQCYSIFWGGRSVDPCSFRRFLNSWMGDLAIVCHLVSIYLIQFVVMGSHHLWSMPVSLKHSLGSWMFIPKNMIIILAFNRS